ncbi:MAG TPA: alcohol dehydrogenase catalytic domain-containing protein [Nitrososphaerales archaeon]|nr:alcohol dehydrogenase catalytic domain-containing protein [Nitrososphaerales archaeon]
MKSVLLRRPGDPEVADLPVPRAKLGEIVVRMRACGICGTDIEKIHGRYTASAPVLGHEAVGVVEEVGDGVEGLKRGDRVFPHHHVACGECYFCRHGSETMCDHYRGSNLVPGGFSQFFVVPEWNVSRGGVLKLIDGLSFEAASLIEPAACCLRGLRRCAVAGDENVLVVGAGPVGMMHSLILMSRGANVIVSDVSDSKLVFAGEAGVGTVLDARCRDVSAEVKAMTAGRGADLVIVATGDHRAIVQGLDSVRRGGRVCLFGVPPAGAPLDYDISRVFNSEVSIVTSYGATEVDTIESLSLVSGGKVNLERLVTDRFGIEDFSDAIGAAQRGTSMKVLVTNQA